MVATARLLLVTVTSRAVGGTWARLIVVDTCRSRPTGAFAPIPKLMFGAVTVAVICCRLLGVVKPAGGTILMVDVPAPAGSNCRFLDESLALKTAGLLTIVPTVV